MVRFETLRYTTTVKGQVPMQKALVALHDHIFFLQTNPHLLSIETDTQPRGGMLHTFPRDSSASPPGQPSFATTRCYDVVSRVPAAAYFADLLPGLNTVTNHYQISDTRDGIFVFLQAPLGVTQERRWVVESGCIEDEEEGYGDGQFVRKIVEFVTISCPGTMLYGSVKGEQDLHWKKVHAAYVRRLGGEVGMQMLN